MLISINADAVCDATKVLCMFCSWAQKRKL